MSGLIVLQSEKRIWQKKDKGKEIPALYPRLSVNLTFNYKENSDFPNDNNNPYYHNLSFQSFRTIGKGKTHLYFHKAIDLWLNIGYL